MKIEIQDVSTTRKNMVASFTQEEIAAEYNAVVADYVKQARLPGFRPGKAPAAMIQKQFAKQIDGELKQKITAKAYRDGIKEAKLDVLTPISVEPGEVSKDAPASISITLDVRPSFELPEYNEIPTGVAPTDPTEAEIAAAIDAMRSQNAEFKVSEGPAKKGDYIKLAYDGAIDGKPMTGIVPADKQIYAKVPQTWEEVEGENEGLIPGLGKQLADVKPGDKKSVTATFPADFSAVAEIAGKTATYAVEVQEIRTRELPALDETFFKSMQVDSLEALRTRTAENIRGQKDYQNRQSQRRQITDTLNARVDIELPASLVEEETDSVIRSIMEENLRRGVSEEELEKNKKELYESAKKAALNRVKTRLILAKIAEKEKIEIGEKDIDAYIYRQAMMSRERPDAILKELTKNQDRLRAVQQSILFEKTLDLVVSKAKVSIVAPKV